MQGRQAYFFAHAAPKHSNEPKQSMYSVSIGFQNPFCLISIAQKSQKSMPASLAPPCRSPKDFADVSDHCTKGEEQRVRNLKMALIFSIIRLLLFNILYPPVQKANGCPPSNGAEDKKQERKERVYIILLCRSCLMVFAFCPHLHCAVLITLRSGRNHQQRLSGNGRTV